MTDNLVTAAPTTSLLSGLIRETRPKQWVKNVLVFAAPGAAGQLLHAKTLRQSVMTFVIFCMASAATYLINDIIDVDADRLHPTKRTRPIAAGIVPIPVAAVTAGVLLVASLGLALRRTPQLLLVVALYVTLTTLYSTWFKHRPVLDLVALSSGFVLRLLGGGYGTGIKISDWFLVISCFGSLFIATGKREAELRELGADAGAIRPTLAVYSDRYLAFLKSLSAGAVLIAYCLWAVERGDRDADAKVWVLLSIVPFVVAILRYALLVELGKGSAPEEIILGDRELQIVGLVWVGLIALSVYLGHGHVG